MVDPPLTPPTCQCHADGGVAPEAVVVAADTISPIEMPATVVPTRSYNWLKGVASLWIVYHLAGIIIAPLSVPPSSDIVRNSWRGVGWYLQALYLNHGFHFFAPDPGPSTIVRYTAELPDGSTVSGQIPDRKTHRPRLLYHRHFMLTEYLAASEIMNPAVESLHQRALARQIARQHGAESVSISRVSHMLPAMEWCRAGLSLEDPQLYEEQLIGRFEWADF